MAAPAQPTAAPMVPRQLLWDMGWLPWSGGGRGVGLSEPKGPAHMLTAVDLPVQGRATPLRCVAPLWVQLEASARSRLPQTPLAGYSGVPPLAVGVVVGWTTGVGGRATAWVCPRVFF